MNMFNKTITFLIIVVERPEADGAGGLRLLALPPSTGFEALKEANHQSHEHHQHQAYWH